MRQGLQIIGTGALVVGGLVAMSATTVGGGAGTTAAATGVLVVVAALYLVAGLAIRRRIWQRLSAVPPTRPHEGRVAGHRVF